MGNASSDGSGLTFNDHMVRLSEAVREIIDEINPELAKVQQRAELLNPLDQSIGDITDRIMGMIERSELGIFVLSSSSPSAMYELTLMHCLGKPVIPIAFTEAKVQALRGAGITEARSLPYYLKGAYSLLLEDFGAQEVVVDGASISRSELKEGLLPKVRMAAGLDEVAFDAEANPITQFYGLPLLDISATTGLATGYFVNFVQYQLKSRKSVFTLRPDLDKFVILVPESLDEVGGMLDTLKRKATEAGHEVVRIRERDGGVAVEADEQVRGEVLLDAVGRFVVDVPAPLKAQKSSPRYMKLVEEEAKARVQGKSKEKSQEKVDEIRLRKERLEKAMIEKFIGTIRRLSNNPDFVSTRLEFLTIDELISAL